MAITLPSPPKVGMVSLGCPKALVDSERILTRLRADGYAMSGDYAGADVVYAKSWGALPYFGRWDDERALRERHRHFIVDEAKMALTRDAVFSHCLPLRRNVKATDAVLDTPRCLAIEEAENRLHVQKAVMAALVAHPARVVSRVSSGASA